MKVYVIRHGESESNRDKKYTGWHDAPLTDKGREDAKKAAELLKNVRFDQIYASDLCRAMQTAREAIHRCTPQTSPLLREINVGRLADLPLSTLDSEERARLTACGYADFGGESQAEFCERIRAFQKELETLSCDNVAVFAHAGWMRGMLDLVLGIRHLRSTICCNNCTVAIFEYEDATWRLHSWINL